MKVKVYSTETCPWCIKVKDWLTENNVEFENIDVNTNQEAAKEMVAKTGQMGVPVIDIDGEVTEIATTDMCNYNTDIDIVLKAINKLTRRMYE